MNRIEKQTISRLHRAEQDSPKKEKHIVNHQTHDEGIFEILSKHSNRKSDNWIYFWPEGQIHKSLLTMKKGRHLIKNQTQHAMQLLERFPKSTGYLHKMYRLSYSTLKRISKQMILLKLPEYRLSIPDGAKSSLSKGTKYLIQIYLAPPCGPKCISMVKKHIGSELNDTYSLYKIRNLVKGEMAYAYKKGSSRPQTYATTKTQLTKALFYT